MGYFDKLAESQFVNIDGSELLGLWGIFDTKYYVISGPEIKQELKGFLRRFWITFFVLLALVSGGGSAIFGKIFGVVGAVLGPAISMLFMGVLINIWYFRRIKQICKDLEIIVRPITLKHHYLKNTQTFGWGFYIVMELCVLAFCAASFGILADKDAFDFLHPAFRLIFGIFASLFSVSAFIGIGYQIYLKATQPPKQGTT